MAGVAGACACEGGNGSAVTELIVVVDTDFVVPSEVDTITLGITGTDGVRTTVDVPLASVPLPATLVLYPAGARLGPVEIDAAGLRSGTAIVWARAVTSFVREERRIVRVVLWRACTGMDCGPGATCEPSTAACVDAEIPPASLPRWTGTPPRLDGGDADGGTPPLD